MAAPSLASRKKESAETGTESEPDFFCCCCFGLACGCGLFMLNHSLRSALDRPGGGSSEAVASAAEDLAAAAATGADAGEVRGARGGAAAAESAAGSRGGVFNGFEGSG